MQGTGPLPEAFLRSQGGSQSLLPSLRTQGKDSTHTNPTSTPPQGFPTLSAFGRGKGGSELPESGCNPSLSLARDLWGSPSQLDSLQGCVLLQHRHGVLLLQATTNLSSRTAFLENTLFLWREDASHMGQANISRRLPGSST